MAAPSSVDFSTLLAIKIEKCGHLNEELSVIKTVRNKATVCEVFAICHGHGHEFEARCLDWSYVMRRDMQEIIPGLFLGPYAAAMKSKKSCLQEKNITHIVCIRQNIEANFVRPNFPELFSYLVLDIADICTENIIQYIPQVRDFIDNCYNCGGKVLVHGNAGISRSAALVIGYIMEKYGLSYKDAYMYVQQKRFCINPNEGFAQQLTEYEPIYRARQSVNITSKSTSTGSLKRKCQFDSDESIHSDSAMVT